MNPDQIPPGAWAVIAVVLAVVGIGFIYLLTRWLRTFVAWKSFPHPPTGYEGLRYFYEEPRVADPALLIDCILFCVLMLPRYNPKWTQPAVERALCNVRIFVTKEPNFTHPLIGMGRVEVAGLQNGRDIVVGSTLEAFLHECAHRCQEEIEGNPNIDHAGWDTNGVFDVVEEFYVWLRERKGYPPSPATAW